MERFHIAFFTNTYHPVVSGVVRSVSEYRRTLSENGHNVFVFAQHDSEYIDQEPFIFRYPSLELPISVDIPAVIPVSPFIDRLLPHIKLDLIHTHHPVLLGQTAAHLAHKLDLPLVFTFHTQYREYSHYFPLPQASVQQFVKNLIDDWLVDYLQRCNHIVVPSESMRTLLVDAYGLEERFTVVPTGIDLTAFECADGEELRRRMGWQQDKIIISVGRLAPEKNWKTLLEATAHALQTYPTLRLVLIGDGPQRQELEKHAQTLGIAPRVTFVGWLPFDEVPCYLKASDCFGFASQTETQGLVTLEAVAAGLPVAAVEATGTSDIVRHGQEGLLTSNDPIALGTALAAIFSQQDLRQRLTAAALQRAQTFEIHHLTQKLVSVYQQAIEDHRQGRTVQVHKTPSQRPRPHFSIPI
jgi:1,2-diacylglycerol 3-alpha-glucosyltransferase